MASLVQQGRRPRCGPSDQKSTRSDCSTTCDHRWANFCASSYFLCLIPPFLSSLWLSDMYISKVYPFPPTATTPYGLYLRFSGHLESALSASANSCLDSGAHGLSALPSGGKRTDAHTLVRARRGGQVSKGMQGRAAPLQTQTHAHTQTNYYCLTHSVFFFLLHKSGSSNTSRRASHGRQRLICFISCYLRDRDTHQRRTDGRAN